MKRLLFIILFLHALASFGWGTTYTVCSSGCDETIIQAVFDNNDLAGGDVVEVRADTIGGSKTYTETVTWGTDDSGSSDNHVVLQSRSGDAVTITAASTLSTWTDTGVNDEWSIAAPAGVDGGNSLGRFILIKDGVIVSCVTDDSEGAIPSKGYYTLDTGTSPDTIYYRKLDIETMASLTFEAAWDTNLINLNSQDYITIQKLILYGAKNGVFDDTIASPINNIIVQGCIIENMSGHGIFIYKGTNIVVGQPLDGHIYSNIFKYCQKGAVKAGISAGNSWTTSTIEGNYFYRNGWADTETVYDAEGHVVDIASGGSDITITWNLLEDNGYLNGVAYDATHNLGCNVSVDGVSTVEISRNWFKNNYNGSIELGPISGFAGSGYDIFYNVFSGNGRGLSEAVRAYLFIGIKTINSSGGDANLALNIYNNAFYDNQQTAGDWNNGAFCVRLSGSGGFTISGIDLKNNIYFNNTNKGDFRVYTQNAVITYTEDNNLYFRSAGGNYLAIGNIAATTLYPATTSFTDFMTATGALNDLNQDPFWADVANNDFRLQATSPCIDAGADMGLTSDYEGKSTPRGLGVDIGAYELSWGRMLRRFGSLMHAE